MIVVADTSVLLNLCRVNQDGLLQRLFREVVIPPEVATEFTRLASSAARFSGLRLPSWVRQQPCVALPPSLTRMQGLDPGEMAALALALEIHADAVLVDERRGHEVARQLGLKAIGIVAILLRAKSDGSLPLVGPVLDALREDAGFWLSDHFQMHVLRLAGETP